MKQKEYHTINFISLGCAKNLVDSEKMLGLLAEAGFVLVGSDDPAEVCVINTCGFIAEARTEARENIEAMLELKQAGQIGHVVVAGCLAQLWGERLLREYPALDAVIGLAEREELPRHVRRIMGKKSGNSVVNQPFDKQILLDQARLRLTEPNWAYLRISEGCDQQCTFCTIPAIRGHFRSKTPDAILAEAEELVSDGAVELNLIAQETSSYGKDLNGASLAELLRKLNQIDGLAWLRVLYLYPASVDDALIRALAECEKVVPYIDMPLQHISDRILKLMRRRVDRAATERLLDRLREAIPNLTLRTTMLVGFPSETDEEFEELLEFVRRQQFDMLGAFAYSAEEGTPAALMQGQIPDEIKQQRYDRVMMTQQDIAFSRAETYIGRTVNVLPLEELSDLDIQDLELDRKRRWIAGRHAGQAPEMDNSCYISMSDDKQLFDSPFIKARINARIDYDLTGEVVTGGSE